MAKFTALIRSHRVLAEVGVALIALGGAIGVGFEPTAPATSSPTTIAPSSGPA